MSYNYLPLDSKWLNFQQVKNLLDYDQLVSITFDAHEKILQCREYLDKKLATNGEVYPGINANPDESTTAKLTKEQLQQLSYNLIKNNANGSGEEVPVEVVKLLLMLKIKSLSYGYSGVQIETVKRLMELYNNGAIPVVYTHNTTVESGASSSLSDLSLPLIGLGEVNYKGKKTASGKVLQQLGLEKISLQSNEELALTTGTHFMSAYGMYCLKKAGQLIRMADAIAAVSFIVAGYNIQPLHEKQRSIKNYKGEQDAITAITSYIGGGDLISETKYTEPPKSFTCVPQVHGLTKDTFGYVLGIFLNEINSVTESLLIFPGDDLIMSNASCSEVPLALALDFICVAISELANISSIRISVLVQDQKDFGMAQTRAAGIVSENKHLCIPASIHSNLPGSNRQDDANAITSSATTCLRLIDNVEQVLAIELIIASRLIENKQPQKSSPFIEKLMNDFIHQIPLVKQHNITDEDLAKAKNFVASYANLNDND